MEQVKFKKDTTHVVVQFNEKSKDGKKTIDLVPISWVYQNDEQLFCKYPTKKKEYNNLNKMCKTSAAHGPFWKSFEITIIKQAGNYNQGIRRMEKAFSNKVVQSSNLEDYNSSEVEEDNLKLDTHEVKQYLKNIPSFNKNSIFDDVESSADENSSIHSNDTKQQNLASDHSTSSAGSSIAHSFVEKKSLKRSRKHATSSSSSSSTTSLPTSKFKKLPSAKTKIIKLPNEKIQSPTNLKIDALQGSNNKKAQTSSNIKKMNPCRTCGCTCSTGSSSSETVTKAQLESIKRSIEYKITQEAKITRHLFASHNNVGDIEKIMQDEQINNIPKLNLEDFQDFDTQLKTDLELIKKLKCFMLINIKSGIKVTENLTAVMPRIISKDVQLLYSGFGRETNGCKKLNFSATETYKHLIEVITTKDPGLKMKDISSQLSRWFSGAKDREGGKKERQYLKMKETSKVEENTNE